MGNHLRKNAESEEHKMPEVLRIQMNESKFEPKSTADSAGEISSDNFKKRGLDTSSICEDETKFGKEIDISYGAFDGKVLEKEGVTPFGILLAACREMADGKRAIHGFVSVIGRRREMEDAVSLHTGCEIGPFNFYSVYDGHNGPGVAAMCRERMHQLMADETAAAAAASMGRRGRVDWKGVMASVFLRMDEEASNRGGDLAEGVKVGSSALVAVVAEDVVAVANCGSSRAVLFRDGITVPLSQDHKPDRADEKARIEAAGGRVVNRDGARVQGILATSRSIGDRYLKPYVISEPEVTVTNRTERDEFMVMASDGLWDYVSNEDACEIVKRYINGQIRRRVVPDDEQNGCNTAEAAAVLLAELALAKGSRDNISVVVVVLRNSR